MKKNRTTSLSSTQQKRLIIVIGCLLTAAFIYIVFLADQSMLSVMKKKSRLNDLQKEKMELEKNNIVLEKEIGKAKNDLEYLETVARDRNMLKKNEFIIDFSEKSKKENKK